MRPTCFTLTKFCPTLPNFKEAATKNRRAPLGSPIFCQAILSHFLVCLVSQNTLAPSKRAYRYGIMLIQKRAKLKRTSMQQAWTEKISLTVRTKISIFSGFKEQLALGRTCHYWQMYRNRREGVQFNYYGFQIFPSQIINEKQLKFKVYFHQTKKADASALLYRIRETVWNIKRRSDARHWNGYLKRANFLIDVLGIKGKIVNSQCDHF